MQPVTLKEVIQQTDSQQQNQQPEQRKAVGNFDLYEKAKHYFVDKASALCLSGEFKITESNMETIKQLIYYALEDKKFNGNLKKGICLYGPKGVGKSIMLKTLNTMVTDTQSFKIDNIISLGGYFAQIGDAMFNDIKSLNRVSGTINHRMCNDLGREIDKSMYMGNTEDVGARYIFERYEIFQNHRVKTHFTTNLDSDQLLKRYGNLNHDRLKEMCNLIYVGGESHRA
jgi:DNA replication protein DnaC